MAAQMLPMHNDTGASTFDDYDTPHDTGMPAILAGILVPHIICTIVIIGRVISRLHRRLHPDILLAPDERDLQHDLDLATADGGPGSVHPYIMRTYLGLIFYQLCLCLTKLSVLTFYLRMFSGKRRERWLARATIAFVLLYGVPLLFVSVFQCHPQEGEFFGRPMRCVGFAPLLISSASLHTATDAWIIIMVIPLSIFVIAASLLRLQLSLHRHFQPGSVGVTNTLAFFVMTILECDVALICASAPMLRPVLARVWPRMMGDAQATGRVVGGRRKGARAGKRRSARPLRDVSDDESVDLTTMVSYRGYPWRRSRVLNDDHGHGHGHDASKSTKEAAGQGRVYGLWRTGDAANTAPEMTEVDLENNNTNNNNSSSTKMEAANSERGMTQLSLRSLFGSTRRLAQQAPGLQQYRDNEIQTIVLALVPANAASAPADTSKGRQDGAEEEARERDVGGALGQEPGELRPGDQRPQELEQDVPVSGLSGETYAVSLDDDDEDRVGRLSMRPRLDRRPE
ncbi:unnamed protein product [Parascedosporium putredinis]|uniref:Rhodopsin domain-containing protein n=1 Tax=Parascedosporium putredinis TaxID=1442378 RepID=A0A9P1H0Z1_9PEZI|nr:unnamed protein product [Parascedosporium putredinis]CAI7992283.1 unnamed protein product [Parascedosporium putredinis]